MPENTQLTYFEQRMALLGITPEINKVALWQYIPGKDGSPGDNGLVDFPIFTQGPRGIDILVYRLNRYKIKTTKDAQRSSVAVKLMDKDYIVTRLETPIEKNGDTIKYLLPKGQPTQPFFPPRLLAHYEKCVKWKAENPGKALPPKSRIGALYMTEGYFKAFKADMHGIHCVGIASITCMTNKETGALHEDIERLLLACEVERFVWLTDGDCRNITGKEITDGTDLFKRPWGFYSSIKKFTDLTSKYEDIRKYFAHIQSEDLDKHPKGLDDLLCAYPELDENIARECNDFSYGVSKGVFSGTYLYRREIQSMNSIKRYFMLSDVDEFYNHHVQYRRELESYAFKYDGSMYRYNPEQSKCMVEIPGAAERYFRVGDNYYEWVHIPNKFGESIKTYKPRKKETIKDDHIKRHKNIFDHIPKYADFCVVPSHTEYQPIKDNCFNKYIALPHEPEPGECPVSMDFLQHIFGDKPVTLENGTTVPYWELGLDYLTVLYRYPQHSLPILCLVSKENSTGKSTFLDWLNYIFVENMIQVGNEDLANQFNAYWTSKLIVSCDETKVDKQLVFEKIKRLSTGNSNISQGKGTNQEVVESFLKFIFCSNNEDSFVNITERDNRFWVLKVPQFKKENVGMREDLKSELDAFVYLLQTRQMVTKNNTRLWFDYHLLRTEALEKLIGNSMPKMERRIREEITELFCMMPESTPAIRVPLHDLAYYLLNKADKDWCRRALNNMGYKTQPIGRGTYPRRIEVTGGEIGQEAVKEVKLESVAFHTTYYEFKREDFIKPEMVAATDVMVSMSNHAEPAKEDLPF